MSTVNYSHKEIKSMKIKQTTKIKVGVMGVVFAAVFLAVWAVMPANGAEAAFSCDTGTVNDTCTISATKTMTAGGETITGSGNLVINAAVNPDATTATSTSYFNFSGNITINSGGSITTNFQATSTDFTVNTGGSINVNSKGCVGGTGDGGHGVGYSTTTGACASVGTGSGYGGGSATLGGGGGAHGGDGGTGQSSGGVGGTSYDSTTQPIALGAGGGAGDGNANGGAGGGAVKIIASGTIDISGSISANGANGSAGTDGGGGGAGGSVWLQANTIIGNNNITANGGTGNTTAFDGGGGGGGRIAVYYANSTYTGSMTAGGGEGTAAGDGSAGTVYQENTTSNTATLITGGNTTSSNTNFSKITQITVDSGSTVSFDSFATSTENFPVLTTIIINGTLTHSAGSYLVFDAVTAPNLTNVTINSGGSINVNSKGCAGGTGDGGHGVGYSTTTGACASVGTGSGYGGGSATLGGGGGAHGGNGGTGQLSGGVGGTSYDSTTQPIALGAGGGAGDGNANGGAGGGAVKIIASGTIDISGSISANGANGSAGTDGGGGGAGGSVWLQANTIIGNNNITANGGTGNTTTYDGGGGGGGRIAVYYANSTYTGSMTTGGGEGTAAQDGFDGTVYVKDTSRNAMIATWKATGASNWSTASNWNSGIVPTSADDAIFNSASTQNATVDTGFGGTVGNLNIGSGYTGMITLAKNLVINGGATSTAGTFNANGYTTNVAGLTTINGGTYQASTTTQTFTGGLNISSGTFTGGGGIVNIPGVFTVSGGAFTGSSGTVNASSTVALSGGTFTAPSGNLNIGSDFNYTGGTFNHNTGTVAYSSSTSQTITGLTYNNLTLSGSGTKTLGGNATTTGNFTINSGVTFDGGSSNLIIQGGGSSLINNGTFNTSAGTITFSTTTAQTIPDLTYNNLVLSDSGTKTLGGNATTTGNFTINSGATLDGAATLYAYGNWTDNGGTHNGTNTVIFASSSNQTIGGAAATSTFYHLRKSTGGALVAPSSVLNVKGNLTLDSGTSFTHNNGTADFSNNTLNSTSTISIPSGNTIAFYNLTKAETATTTLAFTASATTTIAGVLNLSGVAAGKLLLRSSADGTPWKIDAQGTRTMSNLDVKDSNNVNATSMNCLDGCDDSLNNTNWKFGEAGEFDSSFGVNGVSIYQATSSDATNWGRVKIQYKVKDLLVMPAGGQQITPSFSYSTSSGATWNSISSGALAAGDVDTKAISTSTWSVFDATWSATTTIPDFYSTTALIKVTINDADKPANAAVDATSTIAVLNTSKPTVSATSLLINGSSGTVNATSSTATLTLQNITGDASSETVYVQFATGTSPTVWYGADSGGGVISTSTPNGYGSGMTIAAATSTSWTWMLGGRMEKINVRIRDAYNNIADTIASSTASWNNAPEIQSQITALQIATTTDSNWGKARIDFSIRDTDTNLSANTADYVTPTFEYNVGSGWNAIASSSLSYAAAPLNGDYSTYNNATTTKVLTSSYLGYTAYWTPPSELYSASAQIRLTINDNEVIFNTASSTTGGFLLSSTKPVISTNTLKINGASGVVNATSSTATLTLQNITGDASSETVYVQFATGTSPTVWYGANSGGGAVSTSTPNGYGSGMTIATATSTSWTWTLGSRTEKINVRIRDAYNNIADTTASSTASWNNAPEIQSISALQIATTTDSNWGKARIDFSIRDTDTNLSANTADYVTPTFEYNVGSGWNAIASSSLSYAAAPPSGGYSSYGNATTTKVLTSSYLGYTAYWTPPAELYSESALIRLTINDNELIFNTASSTASGFLLSSTKPVVSSNSLKINGTSGTVTATSSTATLTLQNITGDASSETVYVQFATGTSLTVWYGADSGGGVISTSTPNGYGSGMTIATATSTSWTWTLGGRNEKINVRIRDAYNNIADTIASSTASWNNQPEFQSQITALQIATTTDSNWGKIQIQYSIRDTDTNLSENASPGANFSKVKFEYSTSSGSTWTAIATSTITTVDEGSDVWLAEYLKKAVQTSTYNSYTAYWNALTQIPETYSETTKIRVTVDDGEPVYNMASSTNANFTISTTKPTLNSSTLLINDSANSVNATTSAITFKLQNISGDANSETIYVEFASSSTWYGANADGTLATSTLGTGFTVASSTTFSWPWTLQARSETITVRIRDAYNNQAISTDTNVASWNNQPEFQNTITSSQITSNADADWGKVKVDYIVRDRDTSQNSSSTMQNFAQISLQYSTGTPFTTWTNISRTYLTGVAGSDVSGTVGKITITESYPGASSTIYWNAVGQLGNYAGNARVRVTIDDTETIFNSASSTSATISNLDAERPSFSSFTAGTADTNNVKFTDADGDGVADNRNVTLRLNNLVESSSSTQGVYVLFSNNGTNYGTSTDSNGALIFTASTSTISQWEYIASSTLSTFSRDWYLSASGSRSKTVYALVKDAYGNDIASATSASVTWNKRPQFSAGTISNSDNSNYLSASSTSGAMIRQCDIYDTDSNCGTGKIKVIYVPRDPDANESGLATKGQLSTTFEYSTNGTDWTAISALTATTTVATSSADVAGGYNPVYSTTTTYWDASALNSQNNLRVRVTVDDNEAGANTASSTSNIINYDKTNPTGSNITFDAGVAGGTGSASITIPWWNDTSSDNATNTIQYVIADTSTNSSSTTSGWTTVAKNATTTRTWTFDSDIETKSLDFNFRDVYGNVYGTTTVSTVAPIDSATFLIQDVSKVSLGQYRMYIGWGASTSTDFQWYHLEYATSSDGATWGAFQLLPSQPITSSSTSYYVHDGLIYNVYYRYRVGVKDTNGNVTVRSVSAAEDSNGAYTGRANGTQDGNEGGGGTVVTASIVQNVVPTQGADKNVTVNYKLTDSNSGSKTNGYEAHLFYNTGVTLPVSAFNSGAGTLAVSDASKMATSGYIQINNEVLKYTGKSGNTLTGITRGTWPTAGTSRATRQNADGAFFEGTPVWIAATSTSPVSLSGVATSTIASGYSGVTTWNTYYELALAGSSYTNVGVRALVHDGRTSADGPLSSQSDYSEIGILGTLDLTAPTIQFASATSSASEASSTTSFILNLSRAYPLDAVVNYSLTGTATGGGTDYSTSSAQTATISAGATSTTINNTTINNDETNEVDETIILTLNNPSNASLGSQSTHTYTIIDNDIPTLSFSATSSSGYENVNPVSFNVILSNPSTSNISVDYAIVSASTTASAISDYTVNATGTLTISAGSTSTAISVTILNDSVNESNETITISLSNPVNTALSSTLATSTYTILNDDILAYFASATSSASEASSTVSFLITLSEPAISTVTITYEIAASSTASSGVDYVLSGGTAAISANATSTTITATIVEDVLSEPNETIILNLTTSTNAILTGTTTHTYTIIDNEPTGSVEFSVESLSGAESVASVNIPLVLSRALSQDVIIYYSVDSASSTAVGSGTDYTLATGSTTISAASTTANIALTIVNDGIKESNEIIVINLSSASTTVSLGSKTSIIYTITDNDSTPTIVFSSATSSASESVTSTSFQVILSNPSSQDVSVSYALTGAAADDSDYTNSTTTAVISAGATSTTITSIAVTNDNESENSETIILTLSSPSGATLGATSTHTYTILDNDAKTIWFASSSASASESVTSTSVKILLDKTAASDITVNYGFSGTASSSGAVIDYSTSTAQTATIASGNTSTTISITIVDDASNEEDETIIITLSNPSGATLGATTTFTYIIIDEDNSPPQFSTTTLVSVDRVATSSDANFGKAVITYNIRDIDTNVALNSANRYKTTPSFEFNLGNSWQSISSNSITLASSTDNIKQDINQSVALTDYQTFTAVWSPTSTSAATGVYSSTTQIRITLSDGETKNSTSTATSTLFALDTKAPTTAFTLNSSNDNINLTVVEDSNFEYRVSNNSDLSSDGVNTTTTIVSGSWNTISATSTYTATSSWTFATSTYETIYLEAKDAFNNISTSTIVAPYAPSNFTIKDITNLSLSKYQEFLSWDAYTATTSAAFSSYQIYRATSTDGVYVLLTSITNTSTVNYSDLNLSSSTTYYYKMRIADSDNDISGYSSIVSDQPDAADDTTAPTFSNIVAAPDTNWAKISWNANELSDSAVDYGLTGGSYTASSTSGVLIASSTAHEITLSNLATSTTYYYRIRSTDVAGNQGASAESSFTTLNGPIITNVACIDATDNSIKIIWNTDINSDSVVNYATSAAAVSLASDVGSGNVGESASSSVSGTTRYQHTVTLSGLAQGTNYYFRVKSTANNIASILNNNNNYYQCKTSYDTKPPVISDIATPLITDTSAVITWTTDEPSTSKVEYGTASTLTNNYTSSTSRDNALTISHVITITGLAKETKYYYRVQSYDMNPDSATAVSDEQNLTTASEKQIIIVYISSGGGGGGIVEKDTTAPVISNIQISDITSFEATISFDTNEDAIGIIEYGLTTDYGLSTAASNYTKGQTIKLSGLRMGIDYHFRIKAIDKSGNYAYSGDQTFKTKYFAESLKELITLDRAYQFQEELEKSIESLLPSLLPPFIEEPRVLDIAENSAVIKWKTNVAAYSVASYASENDYELNKAKDNPYTAEISNTETKTTNHELNIGGLMPNTLYHFIVKSFSLPKVVGVSKDMTFVTKASKVVPRIADIDKDAIRIVWTTDEKASSIVEYRNTRTGDINRLIKDEKVIDHDVRLENLSHDTVYEIKIMGYNEKNNLIEGGELITVRTSRDIIAPTISNLKINSAMVPGRNDRIQTIVSWKTNEPANSVVEYEEGSGKSTDKLANSDGDKQFYSDNHDVIITKLKPGALYRIRVISVDEAGNKTASPIRTIITPRQSESIVDVIVKNFEDTFQFLKKLR